MTVYKIFLKNFSKTGYSLFTVKETKSSTVFLTEDSILFPFFTEKQTRLLESVFREIKVKISNALSLESSEETRIEIWIPPVLFFRKLERAFLRKLIVLCNNLATNSKVKISIKTYKSSIKTYLVFRKLGKISKYDLWYQLQDGIQSLDITEF